MRKREGNGTGADLEAASDADLCRAYGEGDRDASEVLFGRYRQLVETEYKNLKHASRKSSYVKAREQEDLMQEGYVGMLEAMGRYREDGGASFPTYAKYWIRKRMKAYYAVCLREAVKTVDTSWEHRSASWFFEEERDGNRYYLAGLYLGRYEGAEREAFRKLETDSVRRAMTQIRSREEYLCLWYRYGFDDKSHSCDETAARLNWARRTVRRIEKRGLKHIRELIEEDPYAVCPDPRLRVKRFSFMLREDDLLLFRDTASREQDVPLKL